MEDYKIEEKEHFNRIVANDGYWIKVGDEYVKNGYFPKTFEVVIVSDKEKADEWIKKGAQPTDTVKRLLKK